MGWAGSRVFTDGTWTSGTVLTANQAIGTTIVSKTGINAGWYLVAVSGSCDLAWIYDVNWFKSDGVTVKAKQRRQPAAGNDDFIFASAIAIVDGDQIVVKVAGAAVSPVIGLQMSIYMEALA